MPSHTAPGTGITWPRPAIVKSSKPKKSAPGDVLPNVTDVNRLSSSCVVRPKKSTPPPSVFVALGTVMSVYSPLASSSVTWPSKSPMSMPKKPNAATASLNWIEKGLVPSQNFVPEVG